MKITELLEVKGQLLLEGGAALKGSSPVTQTEAKKLIPFLIKQVASELKISTKKVKALGSAGNKPGPDDLSGDIDLAVQASVEEVTKALPNLAHDKKTFRVMKGINVYSFSATINSKIVQVDLVPVENIDFATWSFQAHPDDLKRELKGAHRNEIFFAVAKLANHNVIEQGDEELPVTVGRYFYDLSKGLMQGVQTRKGKRKLKKGFSTIEKKLITSDPAEITKILFGDTVKPTDVETFAGAWTALNSKKFPFLDQCDKIKQMIKNGIHKKGLVMPQELKDERGT